ncbi:PDR/VanB family oxidoreductase [Paraburkholderia sp. C35]|uniref:PDR/VanB family oxidoreductase n=1 Tax=Paraburkholderia sp. C35 TaxID=2126993 RepID=UPI001EF61D65|nr:PDR/VanB family oxidoreductase [Paraburkholderia sp. C35]
MKVTVVRKVKEATDICRFELAGLDGATLPAFSAGAHIDVHVNEDTVRQYSLCNPSHETHRYVIGVLRESASRGGSEAMHRDVKEGDVLTISEPKNHFPLAHDAKRTILIAGGIGVTPILCMAHRLSHVGAPFEMHYCARSADRLAFWSTIEQSPFASQVVLHLSDGDRSQLFDATSVLSAPSPDTHLYVCGPKGFMDMVIQTARSQGWAETAIHREYFAGSTVDTSSDRGFKVKLASSGQVIPIAPDESVVEALAKCGIDVPVSCEQGVCGTCLTRVLDGEPDHRDVFLTDAEHAANDQFTPCCSRSKSGLLVLDL